MLDYFFIELLLIFRPVAEVAVAGSFLAYFFVQRSKRKKRKEIIDRHIENGWSVRSLEHMFSSMEL